MEKETQFESPRLQALKRKLANYAIFEAMMDAADDGDFTREEAIGSLRSETL